LPADFKGRKEAVHLAPGIGDDLLRFRPLLTFEFVKDESEISKVVVREPGAIVEEAAAQ
jgi:hypothetical protein